jgi:serine/threonine-protein kinase
VVLMEMLTGRRLFAGETVSHILASVLKEEPNWNQLPGDLPPRLLELLKRCLHKKARKRLQAIGDARIVLEDYLADPGAFEEAAKQGITAVRQRPAWQRLLPWAVSGLLAAGLIGAMWSLWPEARQAQMPRRLSIRIPEEKTLFRGYGSSVLISPDGSRIAYVVRFQQGRELHLRFLNQWDGVMVAAARGNLGPYQPFFSPDGQWLGFVTPTELKKVPVRGGTPITLCKVNFNRGASWGTDGNIIFAPNPDSGLFRVSATGGNPEPLTDLDKEANETTHRWPQVLPGGKAVLFTSLSEGSRFESASLEVLNLKTGKRRVLHRGASYGRYVGSGHVIYSNQGTLFAFPFDLNTLEVTGLAAPVIEGLDREWGQGGAQFSVSKDGTLVYAIAGSGSEGASLIWADRQGNTTPLWEQTQNYRNPVLSPDGTRLAVDIESEGNRDIWIYDLGRDVPTRLTFSDGEEGWPVWSPDGEHIYFASDRDGGLPNIYRKAADGSSEAERVQESQRGQAPASISPDGKRLLYLENSPDTSVDIWIRPLEGEGQPERVVSTPVFDSGAQFSPDGRWIAYGSNESGTFEVYVLPATGARGKWQISADGGTWPRWSGDGRELFYARQFEEIMSVEVETDGGTIHAGRPRSLFRANLPPPGPNNPYVVASDGKRFVLVDQGQRDKTATHEHIEVVLNWFDELERTIAPTASGSR